MESTKLTQLKQSVYIPPAKSEEPQTVPPYHPCLIVHDSHTDLTKIKPCGCSSAYCVKNAPEWIPRAKH
ncbi:hypothetical protein HYPBUDRAFT_196345 [Hyphopichia burtonii NRRL Y-1933]|uniref:Uncharacterized protein n=1 Tax=Hyphopichia burtonii NRRL Y-1933 TaxID=984485 RepID=A0A1E4RJX8_9ASCO|nr:hypothetical protein HYPBUDRAFT_196345 [Hyphopichia burtonii NRRL Y-1933]ODV67530.1 hypothetical protein HYPBUDRAFT_196345 [Hyphopichia burtonii NRRL Y-1933]